MQGRGILGGLTLGTETSAGDDPNPDFGSLWAQAAVDRRQRNDSNIVTSPMSNQLPSLNNPDLGIQWRGVAPGADLGFASISRDSFLVTIGFADRIEPRAISGSDGRERSRSGHLPTSHRADRIHSRPIERADGVHSRRLRRHSLSETMVGSTEHT
jgi:hypothetical protein